MNRRTPLAAILLAPVAVRGLMLLWITTFMALIVSHRQCATVLERRRSSGGQGVRGQAQRNAMSVPEVGARLAHQVLTVLQTEPAPAVRSVAGRALGQLGRPQPLPEVVPRALHAVVPRESYFATPAAARSARSGHAPQCRSGGGAGPVRRSSPAPDRWLQTAGAGPVTRTGIRSVSRLGLVRSG